MKTILKLKIIVDAAMTASMLLLMAYGLVGEAAHEWVGMGMFALFVLHHVLNRRWIGAVPNGRYTPIRIVQTVLAGLIFLCMLDSMVSGIVISRHVFSFLPGHGGYVLLGRLHILCAYWEFVKESDYFTVEYFPKELNGIHKVFGFKSGRDTDKVKETGLTPEFEEHGILFKEASEVYVCKKIYMKQMDRNEEPDDVVAMYNDPDNIIFGESHYMVIGEIVDHIIR